LVELFMNTFIRIYAVYSVDKQCNSLSVKATGNVSK